MVCYRFPSPRSNEGEREREKAFPPPHNNGVESAEHCDENRFSLGQRCVSKHGGWIRVGQMVARAAFATNRCETCTLVHDSLKFSKFPVPDRRLLLFRSAAKSWFGMLLGDAILMEIDGMIFNNS